MASQTKQNKPFWRTKSLGEMTPKEWESLCDGCGKCCLEKLEDELTGAISYTSVACSLLNLETCKCAKYEKRQKLMNDCIQLDAKNVSEFKWMPSTCAYRLLAEGKDLPSWHPLVSNDPDSAIKAGITIKGRAVKSKDASELEKYIVDWPE
ncbi:MAG: YcgN family cysteine cluster protein [Rhodospirillaceae bacterium]|nr:YcgN family cysteine cluster protein [Rhodospirillaceae bacterium]